MIGVILKGVIDVKHSLGVASHYHCGLQTIANNKKNMTDYERCLLFELRKLLACTRVGFSFR